MKVYFLLPIFFIQCYTYLGEEIPNRIRSKFSGAKVSFTYTVSVDEYSNLKEWRNRIQTYLTRSPFVEKAKEISPKEQRAANHFDIYIHGGNEYRSLWLTSISSLFMLATFTLLPAVDEELHTFRFDYYNKDKFSQTLTFQQSRNLIVGVIPLFIHIFSRKKNVDEELVENVFANLLEKFQ